MKAPFLLALLCLFGAVSSATVDPLTLYAAGRCEGFSLAPLACQSTMQGSWSSVWTAPSLGLSQEYFEAKMYGAVVSTTERFVSYLDVISSLPYKRCAEAYARLMCPTFFPPCIANTNPATNATIPVLPVPVCRSVCRALNDACRDFEHGADLVDCNNTNSSLTGLAQWPEDSPFCTSSPYVAEASEPVSLEYSCPPPLVFEPEIPDQYTGLGCSSTCHEKLFIVSSHDKFYSLYYIITVISWVSFVLVCILIVTILLFEPLRQYPTRIVLYISIGLFFAHLGPVGASFIGINYACKSHTQLAFGISYCSFYAWCLYFGGLVVVIFWCFQAFVIFYNVALGRSENQGDRKYEWLVVLFGFGYPIVASIILSTVPVNGVGHPGLVPWCTGAQNQPAYHVDLQWGLWYPFFVLTGLLTTIFIGVSLVRLVYEGYQSSMKSSSLFKFFMLMTIFCIYFLVADTSILAIAFDAQVQNDYIRGSIAEWYSCLFSWRIPTGDCPKGAAHYGIAVWDTFSFPLAGTVLFICFFVLRERTWRCWWQLITNVKEGRPAFDGITRRTTSVSH